MDGIVAQIFQRGHQLVLGFPGAVTTGFAVLVGDGDPDVAGAGAAAAHSRGQRVLVELAEDGGGADQKVAQGGHHGGGEVGELDGQLADRLGGREGKDPELFGS